jgi:hydrogenase maturation protein HypF
MKNWPASDWQATCRLAITVRGVVQGVGFRPFVYNAARAHGLSGWVRNEADMVRIEVQGDRAAVDAFLGDLRERYPPQARIDAIDVQDNSPLPLGEGAGVRAGSETPPCPHPNHLPEGEGTVSFEIRASEGHSAPRPTIPADLATCRDCSAEIRDPSERRHNYPFTNCTNCGPRWSIIEQLPYDRPRTSMASFAMCPDCRAEYDDPADRRFHAQPIACPRCGPALQLLECSDSSPLSVEGTDIPGNVATPKESGDESPHSKTEDALNAAARLLLAGRIVAMKGLGGFQLLADATNAEAVARLRQRKRRPDQPFAIMVATLDEARRYCEVSEVEAEMLSSHRAPIVLLRRKRTDVCHCLLASSADAAGDPGTACKQAVAHRSPLPSPFSLLPSPPAPLPPSPVPGVAPGNPYLGVMLPYTPLHHLLLAAVGRPLVCTSGNLSEEPMAITIEDARRRLGPIADAILTHNRPIVRPVDDSIVRVGPDGPQVLRRARGFAPLPIDLRPRRTGCQPVPEIAAVEDAVGQVGNLSYDSATVLAVGGHLKNTVALSLGVGKRGQSPFVRSTLRAVPANGDCPLFPASVRASTHPTQVVLSAHVGDLDSVLSVDVFRRAIDDLVNFFQVVPDAVVCDLHPDYASTRHAQQLSSQWDVPLVRVQHHHAHVAACMAEHGLGGPVLGFSWDGTGYGPDGTVWGGEVLLCEGAEFRRVAHLRTFALPGGDAAVREPRRSALGLLFEMFGPNAADHAAQWFTAAELSTLLSMLAHRVNSPRTSSMGRLFDAVAALCGLSPVITFEGQAAMSLEYAADEGEQTSYPVLIASDSNRVPLLETSSAAPPDLTQHCLSQAVAHTSDEGGLALDWAPLVRGVLADRAAGVPVPRISARFHNALADMAVAVAERLTPTKALPIVLTGGCFQNALLTARVRSRLAAAGFSVYTHQEVPPGDGGIALGQVFLALQQLGRL